MNRINSITRPNPTRPDGLLKMIWAARNPFWMRLLPAFLKPPVFHPILGGLRISPGAGLTSPAIPNVLQTSLAFGRVDAATRYSCQELNTSITTGDA